MNVGMVFTADERQNLATEDRFPAFLQENARAYVAAGSVETRSSGVKETLVRADVAEWYLPLGHAKESLFFSATAPTKRSLKQRLLSARTWGRYARVHNYDLQKL